MGIHLGYVGFKEKESSRRKKCTRIRRGDCRIGGKNFYSVECKAWSLRNKGCLVRGAWKATLLGGKERFVTRVPLIARKREPKRPAKPKTRSAMAATSEQPGERRLK